ncbi:hypothetical protein EJ02DRAFT_108848 [Clathrospora elynae]|uniref:Uncharacterized protein n=1 Tax=Clathrospora elynae TaxID=706981 RepID=A0A6A5T055_9PLEO|nr:hypothetical protein EJ02DRAFT_108848 [Clathrospora elynae]
MMVNAILSLHTLNFPLGSLSRAAAFSHAISSQSTPLHYTCTISHGYAGCPHSAIVFTRENTQFRSISILVFGVLLHEAALVQWIDSTVL